MAITIGLDFGEANTGLYVRGQGIVLREPTVAAVDTQGNVLAVGSEALLIHGRSPGTVTLRSPMRAGEIVDFNLTAEYLDRILEIAVPRQRKRAVLAVKCGLGGSFASTLKEALDDCRIGTEAVVDTPAAAFHGLDEQPVESLRGGILICDIGAGGIEVSYLREGEILRTELFSGGGGESDRILCAYLRRRYGLAVNFRTARALKHKVSLTEDGSFEALGLDGSTGLPRRLTLKSEELLSCLHAQTDAAAECITTVLANLPTQGLEKSVCDGILLIGGGAALPGLGEYLSDLLERPVNVVPDPGDCVLRGLGRMIEGGK
ncbi:MAG: rod shape-determining protein [Clostridia bacterium]|nr:rod shape-determining protein [Clostridia bacterium]